MLLPQKTTRLKYSIDILVVLCGGIEGSRVLITLDNENVANEIKSAAQMQKAAGEQFDVQRHRLVQLTANEGWKLLFRTACLDQVNNTESLRTIGIGIVQKCDGIPLAIKAVGAVLAQISCSTPEECNTSDEWTAIRDSSALSLTDPATGTEARVMGSIYLSYQDALPHLKQCFLYLSLFPADVEIEQHSVTQLWISEGLVDRQDESKSQKNTQVMAPVQEVDTVEQSREESKGSSEEISQEISEVRQMVPSPNREHSSQLTETKKNVCSVEETAERYFNELVGRSLLQTGHQTNGYIMHEQVRRIAEVLTKNEVCAGDPNMVGLSICHLI